MFQVIEPCVGYLHIGTYELCKEKPYRSFKFLTTIIFDTTVKRQVTHISNKQTRVLRIHVYMQYLYPEPLLYTKRTESVSRELVASSTLDNWPGQELLGM